MTASDDPTDQRSDDFERGLANRRAMLGDDWVERSTAGANAFNAEFQEFITRYAWHEIWGRPGLDKTTRRLLVLGMTMGLARWEEFELHCRAAVRGGVPLVKIQETLLQGAIYCGVPAANTAFKITGDILKAEGLAPLPQPLTRAARPRVQHTFSQPQLSLVLQGDGAGVPIVFSPALGLDLHFWDGLATQLAAQHPTLRYDHRGHGESSVPAGPYRLDDLVDDAARLIREWGRGPVVFVGLSLGGVIGQRLAVLHPALLRGLVLVDTRFERSAEDQRWWAQCRTAAEAGRRDEVANLLVDRYVPRGVSTAQAQSMADALRQRASTQNLSAFIAAGDVEHLGIDVESLKSASCVALIVTSGSDCAATLDPGEMSLYLPQAQVDVLNDVSSAAELGNSEDLCKFIEGFASRLGTNCA